MAGVQTAELEKGTAQYRYAAFLLPTPVLGRRVGAVEPLSSDGGDGSGGDAVAASGSSTGSSRVVHNGDGELRVELVGLPASWWEG